MVSTAACYPLIFPQHMTIAGGGSLAVSPLGKTPIGGGESTNNLFFNKSFFSSHTKLGEQQNINTSLMNGSPVSSSHEPTTTGMGSWSPSPSSSLVLAEALTPPTTTITTTAKSPMMISFATSGGLHANSSSSGSSSSNNSSPKTPSSLHCVSSPRSVGSSANESTTGSCQQQQQQQQLMLGSPLHIGGGSPKSRNRRNSSFDETKPHVCPQCGARFTTKSNLGQHAKIHLAVKPFICEICSHGFTRAAHYESHVAKHKGLKTHR
jgi:hypothetical protein